MLLTLNTCNIHTNVADGGRDLFRRRCWRDGWNNLNLEAILQYVSPVSAAEDGQT